MEEDGHIKPFNASVETPSISKQTPSDDVLSLIEQTFKDFRHFWVIPPSINIKDYYSDFFRSLLQVRSIQRGKISCLLTVKPPITVKDIEAFDSFFLNYYNGMHGGAVAAVTQLLALACARTVVGKDKSLFLGEMSASYLSSAPENAKVIVDGSMVKSGRNVTAVAIEFKLEESGQLIYSTRATFYNIPAASL